jgi:hypothetical protein
MFIFVMGVLCYIFAFKAFTWVSLALNKKIEQRKRSNDVNCHCLSALCVVWLKGRMGELSSSVTRHSKLYLV